MSDWTASDLESHLGYWLRKASNHVSSSFARSLAEHGVSVAEWVALQRLSKRAQLSPSELAECLGMTQGAISKIVDKLLAKGWVSVEENQSDRRGRFLTVTPAGSEGLPKLAALADANDDHFFGPLSVDDRAELRRLLERLAEIHQWEDVPVS